MMRSLAPVFLLCVARAVGRAALRLLGVGLLLRLIRPLSARRA